MLWRLIYAHGGFLPMVEAADLVLSLVLPSGVGVLRYALAPAALEKLSGHGITLEPEQKFSEDTEAWAMGTNAGDERIAEVDVEQVLAESVAPLGFSLGERLEDFVELRRADIPAACRIFFLRRYATPVYSIRALAKQPALVVLHVNNELDEDLMNPGLGALGIHCRRLRTLGDLNEETLQHLIGPLAGVGSAVEELAHPSPAVVAREAKSRAEVDPSKVVEYAFTQKDTPFENATARIIAPMFHHLFPLGAAFRGKPVPDGIIIGEKGPQGRQKLVVSYDCKSKKDDVFGFEPSEGDQQSRYLLIQERLAEQDPTFEGKGAILFVPDASQVDVEDRLKKDIWRRLAEEQRRLIVVPAKVLKRWWDLQGEESPGRLPTILNKAYVWDALFEAKLPDVNDAGRKLFSSSSSARVITETDAELIWLAGLLARPHRITQTVADSLDATDPGSSIKPRMELPHLVFRFYQALGPKKASWASLAAATGLAPPALEYLMVNTTFDGQGAWVGVGDHVVANKKQFTQEVLGRWNATTTPTSRH
jgi:hypothetical protein